MAAPLRYALTLLAWLCMLVVYAPLVPASVLLISPALSFAHWQALFADPQLPQALLATVVSTIVAAVGALFIALAIVVSLWPGDRWRSLAGRLPWLLAIPHVAFASATLLLFAEGGLLCRALPAQPLALLLDEPFARLDADRRADFRQWVFEEVRRLKIPVVQVTHDPEDVPTGGQILRLTSAV